jgi:chaperonin GroEL
MSKPIKSKAEIEQVATISSESTELGAEIARVIEMVGQDGVVTVEESHSFGIESEVVEGMAVSTGASRHFSGACYFCGTLE